VTMRAVRVTALTGPDALRVDDVPAPQLDGSGVLIDVRACGVTFPDLLYTRGLYQLKPEPPFTPGLEVAGVALEASPDAPVAAGDRVTALLPFGGMAERVVAPVAMTFPLVDELSFVEGAGLTANAHTAWFALARRGGLRAGETVLVHGAAGGLGTATLQVAQGLGARTIGVVSTERKAEVARAAGAEQVVLADGWDAAVRELEPGGVDVVADPVGGEDRLKASLRLLAPDGRFVVLGFAGGEIPQIRTNRILFGNVAVVGAAYGEYVSRRPDVAREVARAVNDLVRAGHVRPLVDVTVPMAQAADALRRIEAREAHGKIVVEIV
jgi:NADPH2:quinone reductase